MHEIDGGWTVTGARGVRATKKQQLRASGALFRVYNATLMVGDVSGDGR